MSLDKAILSLTHKDFQFGLSYVGISRVKQWVNLAFGEFKDDHFDLSDKMKIQKNITDKFLKDLQKKDFTKPKNKKRMVEEMHGNEQVEQENVDNE